MQALDLLACEDPEAVVPDLVQPAGSGGRMIGEHGLAGANEADGWITPPTGRWGAPGGGPRVKASALIAIRQRRLPSFTEAGSALAASGMTFSLGFTILSISVASFASAMRFSSR